MAIKIIKEGSTTYRKTCGECATVFSHELEDVRHNYIRGVDQVDCPKCGKACIHFGQTHRWSR